MAILGSTDAILGRYSVLTQNFDVDFTGGWGAHSVAGNALVQTCMMPVCLIDQQGGGLDGFLTGGQNVVLWMKKMSRISFTEFSI